MSRPPNRTLRQPLLFNPTRASTEELEETFVGRHDLLGELEHELLADRTHLQPTHWQILGPRGSGKSHLTELLARRMQQRHGWRTARLPEENYQVGSLGELLEQIVIRSQPGSQRFEHVDDDAELQELCLSRLRELKALAETPLLVVLENLSAFVDRHLRGAKDQDRFKDILTEDPPFVLVATSTSPADATEKGSAPLHEFFRLVVLEDLSAEEISALIKARAGWEKNAALLANFDEVKARLDAVYHLSGGNPRLALALYAVVQDGITAELHDQLMKLLDEVTPYYQQRLSDIPPQASRVLTEMALSRTVVTPAMVARRCRMSTNHVTAHIRKLVQERLIAATAKPDARSRYYEFRDRLLRIWIQMRETGGSERRLRFLAEFYEKWYAGRSAELEAISRRTVSELWSNLIEGDPQKCSGHVKTLSYLAEVKPGFDSSVVLRAMADHVHGTSPADVRQHLDALRSLFEQSEDLHDREFIALLLSESYVTLKAESEAAPYLLQVIRAGSQKETIAENFLDALLAASRFEEAWQFGSRWLEVHPSHWSLSAAAGTAALAVGQVERGLALISGYVSKKICARCAREAATTAIKIGWETADEETRDELWWILARSARDFTPSKEARDASVAVLLAGGVNDVSAEQVLLAASAWPSVERLPTWFVGRFSCFLTHSAGHARDAVPFLEEAFAREKGEISQFLVDHLFELLPELRATEKGVSRQDVDRVMTMLLKKADARKLTTAFSSRAPVIVRQRPDYANDLLVLYQQWRKEGLIAEPVPPYAEATAVIGAPDKTKALEELHPETREAVLMLLGRAKLADWVH